MGEMVAASRGDVDRHVADDPHPALGGVGAERRPLALESHLLRDRIAAGDRRPSRGSSRRSRPRTAAARTAPRRRPDRRAAPATPRTPTSMRTATRYSSGGLSGSTCHQRAPGGGQPVDERERLGAEPAARKRRRVQGDAERPGQPHRQTVYLVGDDVATNPDPGRPAAGRLRPVSGEGVPRRRGSGRRDDLP